MRWKQTVTVVGVHAEGEANHVITGGVLPPPGRTMFERMQNLERDGDALRRMILFHPRGHVAMCVNLVTPPCDPAADAGVIIMEASYYVPMSGSNTIATVTALLETGMLPMREPETVLTLDMPGGLVRVTAECRDGRCERVRFTNVPSLVFRLDAPVEVPGIGTVMVDAAYGGMMYAIVDAARLGFALDRSEARELVRVGEAIKGAAAEQVPVVHPENPEIHTINQTLFAGPLLDRPAGGKTARNTVVVSPGRLDRSPCGTGTSSRMAVLHARGLLRPGEIFDHVSIIDTHFHGRIEQETTIAGQPAVINSISGRGWITGISQLGVDPTDPFPEGFTLPDTWFA